MSSPGTAPLFVTPVVLEGHGVRLEPLQPSHEGALRRAAADGRLWELHFTSVPEPAQTMAYIEKALVEAGLGTRFPFVVREATSGAIIGSTSYHDILPAPKRVEIGYTWYASTWQRSHVNTACKLLLLTHAFDALGCSVVGWRTDILNLRSQAAIERLGARKDGVIRRQAVRRDGTLRDTVMYSVTQEEWRETIQARLQTLLARGTTRGTSA
jgi:RimJ/RimL family protein N-acetyltransferase